MTVSHPKGQI